MSAEGRVKIVCKVWCLDTDADEKNRESGTKIHDTKDFWADYAFDLSDVMNLKRTAPTDFIEEGEATTLTFFTCNTVVVNIVFEELLRKWIEI